MDFFARFEVFNFFFFFFLILSVQNLLEKEKKMVLKGMNSGESFVFIGLEAYKLIELGFEKERTSIGDAFSSFN